jgi:limonene-1,2-epoxide hydrolase
VSESEGPSELIPGALSVVRAVLDAAAAADEQAVLDRFAVDCELDVPQGLLKGHEGVRRLLESRRNDGSVSVGELHDAGDGRVLIALISHTQMGEEKVDLRATSVWTVRSGLIIRIEWFMGGVRRTLAALRDRASVSPEHIGGSPGATTP